MLEMRGGIFKRDTKKFIITFSCWYIALREREPAQGSNFIVMTPSGYCLNGELFFANICKRREFLEVLLIYLIKISNFGYLHENERNFGRLAANQCFS